MDREAFQAFGPGQATQAGPRMVAAAPRAAAISTTESSAATGSSPGGLGLSIRKGAGAGTLMVEEADGWTYPGLVDSGASTALN